ncbi:hypothetical protein [Neobacillus sp. D3-1R]
MDHFSKELKRISEDHPVLTSVFLTIWIWFGFYQLGINVGEFIANIKN